MKRNLLFLALFITTVCARAQFVGGNLVVSKINTSFGQTVITNADNTQNGYYGVLQQMTTAGVNVGSAIALPNIVWDGRSIAFEGGIGLSKDGKSISIVGFTGGAGLNSAGFRASTVGKRIHRLTSAGTLDAGTNIQPTDYSGNGYRSVISADGSNYLVAVGASTTEPGRTIAYGATGTMSPWGKAGGIGTTIRNFSFTGNGLYGCGTGGIYKFNESTGAETLINADNFARVVLFDMDNNAGTGDADGNDVMYAAQVNSGIFKFTWSGSAWVKGSALNAEAVDGTGGNTTANEPGYGAYWVTGSIVAGKPNLYCISHNGSSTGATYASSHIYKIVDNTAANVDWTYPGVVITILASTGNTEMFRGLSFAPQGTLAKPSFEKAAQGWSMYPNPSKGLLNINSEVSGSFNIYNVLGQKVHQFKVESGDNAVSVDRLNSGTYFVEGAKATQKLIIQK